MWWVRCYVDLFSFNFYNESMEDLHACSVVADSLRFTSALSVALAVVFLVIAVGISVVKIISGGIAMPRLFWVTTDLASVFNLFTVVPVFVTAYICHYNGMQAIQTFVPSLFFLLLYLFWGFYMLKTFFFGLKNVVKSILLFL